MSFVSLQLVITLVCFRPYYCYLNSNSLKKEQKAWRIHAKQTQTWCQSSPVGMFRTVAKGPHMSELNLNFGRPLSRKPLQTDATQKRNLWQGSHSETVCNQGPNDALNTKQWKKKMVQWVIFYRMSCIQAGLSYEKAKGCLEPAMSVASCKTCRGICNCTGWRLAQILR